MNRLHVRLLVVILFTFALKSHAVDEKHLFIVGSTSMAQVLELIKPQFYHDAGIEILIRPIGSDKGVVSIAEGLSDIGIVSRFLTEQEMNKWPHLTQVAIGQDAIVFLVNEENPIANVTYDQIRDLYSGKITHWSELDEQPSGGQKAGDSIVLLSKAKRHGTHSSFIDFFRLNSMQANNQKSTLLFKKEGINSLYSKKPAFVFNQIHQAFGNVSRQSNALAFESYGAYTIFSKQQKDRSVKILKLNNQLPIESQVFNKNYEFKRPLNIIISQQPSIEAKEFINYMLSDQGQAALRDNAFLPLE